MPRVFPDGFDPMAKALPRLVTITSPRFTIRFTTWTKPLVVGGNTYPVRAGASVSRMVWRADGEVSNTEFCFIPSADDPVSASDAAIGTLNGALIEIAVCDPSNLAAGKVVFQSGTVGNVRVLLRTGLVIAECRGVLTLARGLEEERFTPNCSVRRFGDDRCRVAVLPADQTRGKTYVLKEDAATVDKDGTGYATRVRTLNDGTPFDYENVFYECTTAGTTHATTPPVYDPTIGNTTTDGTAVFTARDSWARATQIATFVNSFNLILDGSPDPRAVDGWFTLGKLIVRGGPRDGNVVRLANWIEDETRAVSLMNLTGLVAAGDYAEIVKGCLRREVDCQFYDNIINQRAYGKHVPGRNLAMAVA